MLVVIAAYLFLVLLCYVLFRFARSLRRGGGSATTMMLGTTNAFRTVDQQRAAAVIVHQKAGERLDEQDSGDPDRRACPVVP